jgi:hypothetical protein
LLVYGRNRYLHALLGKPGWSSTRDRNCCLFARFAALHSRKDIKFLSLVEDHPVFPKNVCKNLLFFHKSLLRIKGVRRKQNWTIVWERELRKYWYKTVIYICLSIVWERELTNIGMKQLFMFFLSIKLISLLKLPHSHFKISFF